MLQPTYLSCRSFLNLKGAGRIVDVRSPAEYDQGHVPGAVNVPLFSNEERAEIGTLYVQCGQQQAIARGFEIVSPKLEQLRQACLAHAINGTLRMHCWRGGMRSESMAWLLARGGIRVYLLKNGYKTYRTHVLESFAQPRQLIVLGGFTGSGKTDVLHALRERGEQIVDLEGLACHKGSAFGWLGEQPQPTGEQFENELHAKLHLLDPQRRTWVEDESRNIGKVFIPAGLYAQMQAAETVFIKTSDVSRMRRLLRDYTLYPKHDIIDAINRLRKRLGSEAVTQCADAVLADDYPSAIRMVLTYYDKRYAYAMESKTAPHTLLDMGTLSPTEIAQQLSTWAIANGL